MKSKRSTISKHTVFSYKKESISIALSLIFITTIFAQPDFRKLSKNNVIVHDPVMVQENGNYYMFNTGKGISMWKSENMTAWEKYPPVFKTAPDWTVQAVPDFKNHIWAPDIICYNNQFYLYYSVSSFGKNTSCIGLVTNKTLDTSSIDYKWVDQGKIIQSVPGRDEWNAIDPNLIFDEEGQPWLSFGSFWNGIKLVKLNPDLKSVAQPEEWYTIAKRQRDFNIDVRNPGDGAIEAPFIFKKNGFYYLFVSFDYCCRGVNSNYKIMAGRSTTVQGPYVDKDSIRMDKGGGSLVVSGDEKYSGVGHNSVYTFNNKDYMVFHAYDIEKHGISTLMIIPVTWDGELWPIINLTDRKDITKITQK